MLAVQTGQNLAGFHQRKSHDEYVTGSELPWETMCYPVMSRGRVFLSKSKPPTNQSTGSSRDTHQKVQLSLLIQKWHVHVCKVFWEWHRRRQEQQVYMTGGAGWGIVCLAVALPGKKTSWQHLGSTSLQQPEISTCHIFRIMIKVK